jgi:ubiquinone/menaquinone biosynthesis C-methylase UbiE
MSHASVDYSDPSQVAVYDRNHQRFRDYDKASQQIIDRLGLGSEHSVIDMGAGTGAFSLYAAHYCKIIYAVDVSEAMLAYCCQRAEQAGLTNIVFCHGGFLTYEHQATPVDAVISTAVLHHLPDFWKLIGLRRMATMLKPGGTFYLFDVVFPATDENLEPRLDAWVSSFEKNVGPEFAEEVRTHIRDEYSTYDWIMEGLLTWAGFAIESAEYDDHLGAVYVCTKS